ncbi:putative abc multidrug transporter protein [Phaeoacremonium minimum UCRPA7]|uniref:Putative abc multidrug transporter protein n=1 Tax=Phaeoacremonium minimum (strain UCR-PA7) TaxID=1286976 RepID=R8BGP4_PHAM7|nr:putative abc multidrug transporter protein [Phaeoacremonium minimum UCRPA7]EON98397.1 putative abc multidrug transporter protein [Phaeoacremonium minimum UCRPA7]
MEGVSFAYPSRPNQLVLRKVSLDFPAGKHTAIVGPSGSGKSTIQSLIARLQSPQEGAILLDGHDIRELNVKSLRGFLGLVQQEPSLLDRSILENIALGLVSSPHPSHAHLQGVLYGSDLAELASHGKDVFAVAKKQGGAIAEIVDLVRQAADLADASSFIDRLEKGWGTMAGSGGSMLSGGQRQRVAVARALVRDPKILILDEATASLDSASERRIQAAVERAAKSRTVISIAHRLSTIRNADSIIVMQAGEVVEQGSYEELIAREDGVFAHLARLQSLTGSDEIEAKSTASINDTLSSSSSKAEIDLGLDEEKIDALQDHTSPVVSSPKQEQADNDNDKDKDDLAEDLSATAVIKGVGRLVRQWLKWIILALIAAALVGCNFSASGLVFGHTVGALNPCNTTADRVKSLGEFYGGILFMLAVVVLLANFVTWSSFGLVAERLLYSVRVLSFRSLLEQPVSWHQSGNRSSTSLLSIITKDSAALGGLSGSIIGTIFSILINFLVAIILSHIIAWKIAIVCLVVVPILLGAGLMQLRSLSRFEERHTDAYSRANGIAVEAVNSINTIAALSLEREIMGTYSRALKAPRKDIVLASAWVNVWLAINNSTGFLVYAFAYWWGSRLIMRGENTQTQFFIILMAMLVSAQLWGQMFTLAPEFSRARASIARIITVINLGSDAQLDSKELATTANVERRGSSGTERDIEAVGEAKPPVPVNSKGVRVTFDRVSFAYPGRPDVPVLQDVSFTVQPAQFCGLVGPSGAGKSTIMGLVQRLYFPTTGTVTIDGVDISKHSFRDDVAIVPQDTALFDGSVKFNVGLGAKPGHEATDAEIEEACRLAHIHDTIMALPQGYNTECGPRASQLSGGQRQRLSIARALVRKPRLLLLDESTSALDAESERALQASLEVVARDVTVVAITHRLHTVQKADVIYVVEGGKIVDKGRHGDLMERSESYRVNALQQMLQ